MNKLIQSMQKQVRRQIEREKQPTAPVSEAIQNYLKNRLEDQESWYGSKASFNKKRFVNTQKLVIMLGALIPVLAILFSLPLLEDVKPYESFITAFIAATIAIVTGFDKLEGYQTNWYTYRMSEEMLKKEKFLFEHNAGIYAHAESQRARERMLVERIENIIAADVNRFLQQQENQGLPLDFDLEDMLDDHDDEDEESTDKKD